MTMNPWVILSVLMALAGVYGYGHHQGYKEKETCLLYTSDAADE